MKVLVLSNLYPPDYIGGYECGCKQAVDALMRPGPRRPRPDHRPTHPRATTSPTSPTSIAPGG